ncbi:MAG: LppX_LprAFG lipoprotein [Dehalococcoidia bacterium]
MLQSIVAAVGTLLLILVAACDSDQTPTPAAMVDGLSAEEILLKASERFEALRSFHFEMTHQGGGTPIAMGLEMEVAEGDVVFPDRMAATIQARTSGLFLEVSAISIGDNTYLTNPFTRRYEDLSDVITPGGFFDPAEGVGSVIREAKNVSVLAEESLEGVSVFHLSGEVQSEELKPISGSAVEGHTLKAELWVGTEDFLVHKLTLKGRITQDETEDITRTILISAFDEPVTIEAPEPFSTP